MNNTTKIKTTLSETAVPAFYIMRDGEIVELTGYFIDIDANISRQIGDDYFDVPQNPDHAEYLLANIKNSRLSTDTGFRSLYIQRVMMSSFHGEDFFPTAVADHIDCDRQNNHISNLQWLTIGDNSSKARSIPIVVTDIDGNETLCENITETCEFVKLSRTSIDKMLNGKFVKNNNGYSVKRVNN